MGLTILQLHSYVWLGHTVVILGIVSLPLVDESWHDMLHPRPGCQSASLWEALRPTRARRWSVARRWGCRRWRIAVSPLDSGPCTCLHTVSRWPAGSSRKEGNGRWILSWQALKLSRPIRIGRNLNAASLEFGSENNEELLLMEKSIVGRFAWKGDSSFVSRVERAKVSSLKTTCM